MANTITKEQLTVTLDTVADGNAICLFRHPRPPVYVKRDDSRIGWLIAEEGASYSGPFTRAHAEDVIMEMLKDRPMVVSGVDKGEQYDWTALGLFGVPTATQQASGPPEVRKTFSDLLYKGGNCICLSPIGDDMIEGAEYEVTCQNLKNGVRWSLLRIDEKTWVELQSRGQREAMPAHYRVFAGLRRILVWPNADADYRFEVRATRKVLSLDERRLVDEINKAKAQEAQAKTYLAGATPRGDDHFKDAFARYTFGAGEWKSVPELEAAKFDRLIAMRREERTKRYAPMPREEELRIKHQDHLARAFAIPTHHEEPMLSRIMVGRPSGLRSGGKN